MNQEGKKKQIIFIIIAFFLIGGIFYWFAYRPARIRHDCSWVKRVTPATPAQPAITKKDVEDGKREYDKCKKNPQTPNDGSYLSIFENLWCNDLLKKERLAIPAQPESVWYQKANKETYDFCIRENGLWR